MMKLNLLNMEEFGKWRNSVMHFFFTGNICDPSDLEDFKVELNAYGPRINIQGGTSAIFPAHHSLEEFIKDHNNLFPRVDLDVDSYPLTSSLPHKCSSKSSRDVGESEYWILRFSHHFKIGKRLARIYYTSEGLNDRKDCVSADPLAALIVSRKFDDSGSEQIKNLFFRHVKLPVDIIIPKFQDPLDILKSLRGNQYRELDGSEVTSRELRIACDYYGNYHPFQACGLEKEGIGYGVFIDEKGFLGKRINSHLD